MNEIEIKNSINDYINISIEVNLWTYLYDEFFINFYLLNEIEIYHSIKDYLNIK
jgi:hypothetical protein